MWRLVVSILINSVVHTHSFGFKLNDVLRRPVDSTAVLNRHIVSRHGLGDQGEIHKVTTKDGYRLELFRIFRNSNAKCRENLPPVYLFHGLLGSGEQWLELGENRSLPHVLANAGYDVWLGNARGTTYSREHVSLARNSKAFWDFSWHEIAIYDNPANIDYILSHTKSKQLHYIGHSQGTTTFFVLMSLYPKYNKLIKTMHALSPVAFMKNSKSPAFTIPAQNIQTITNLANRLDWYEILPRSSLFESIQKLFCRFSSPSLNLCHVIFSIVGGRNDAQVNTNILQKIQGPAGASVFQLLHYAQLVNSGKFQSYDFGLEENSIRYKNKNPIEYPLQKVNTSIFFHVGINDLISSVTDINTLAQKLPRKPIYYEVADVRWSHMDFMYAKNAKELVYNRVIKDIQQSDNYLCKKRKYV